MNLLESLNGSPDMVYNSFNCGYNLLKTLEGAPREVGGDFYCYGNDMKSVPYHYHIGLNGTIIWE